MQRSSNDTALRFMIRSDLITSFLNLNIDTKLTTIMFNNPVIQINNMNEESEQIDKGKTDAEPQQRQQQSVETAQVQVSQPEKAEVKQADFDDFGEAEEEQSETQTENDFQGYEEKEEESRQETKSNVAQEDNPDEDNPDRESEGLKTTIQKPASEDITEKVSLESDSEKRQADKMQAQNQADEKAEAELVNSGAQKNLQQAKVKAGQNTEDLSKQPQAETSVGQVLPVQVAEGRAQVSEKSVSQVVSEKTIPESQVNTVNNSAIMKQAQSERIGSIYQQFMSYNTMLQKTIASYKIVVNNVSSEIASKKDYKKHLQSILISYFEEYSKIHRAFHAKASKLPKEEEVASVNKFVNMKEELRKGYEELFYLRRHIGVDTHKLDSYINNYIIKSIKQVFQEYREEVIEGERKQFGPKDEFYRQEKQFKKIVQTLEKMCKKGKQGLKYKHDVFVELVRFITQEKAFKAALIALGKTTLALRNKFISAEKKLFGSLSKILNDFKNEQKIVYTAAKQFNFIEDYAAAIDKDARFQRLCTITDVDYIKGVLQLNNRKEKIEFTNKHFEDYLEMPFFHKVVGDSRQLLKGATVKSFRLKKKNCVLVHTITHNLVEYDQQKGECQEAYAIRELGVGEVGGLVELEMVTGMIFKETKKVRVQLLDGDRAQQLISYLKEVQQIKEARESKEDV